MNGIFKGLLAFLAIGGSMAVIPASVQLGLLILATSPNPRHPPADVTGEAMGWAIIGAAAGAICAVIGETVTMRDERSFFIQHRGLVIGSGIGIVIAAFLGMNFAVLQMDSVDGQAITSVNLGIMAGATVSFLGALAGIVLGVTLRRIVIALAS